MLNLPEKYFEDEVDTVKDLRVQSEEENEMSPDESEAESNNPKISGIKKINRVLFNLAASTEHTYVSNVQIAKRVGLPRKSVFIP